LSSFANEGVKILSNKLLKFGLNRRRKSLVKFIPKSIIKTIIIKTKISINLQNYNLYKMYANKQQTVYLVADFQNYISQLQSTIQFDNKPSVQADFTKRSGNYRISSHFTFENNSF